jgi:selenocysteine lyase/cysteine desulfurase
VLRSFPWKPDDILLLFSTTFSMVKHTAEWLSQLYGIQVVTMPIPFPIQDTSVFQDAFHKTLADFSATNDIGRLKVIVLDQMVSAPAVKQPISLLAQMVKQAQPNCFVLVDGAHALGQIPYHQPELLYANVDAYLSNGHKWLYTPKGSAVLWINASQITNLFPEPTVISSTNDMTTSLSERYAYVSARDYTAWLSIGAALQFRQDVLGGEEAIYQYCRTLAKQAKQHLQTVWNTTDIQLVPDEMEEFMVHVALPPAIDTVQRATQLMEFLLDHHKTYIRNLYDADSGILYARLSAQVYLEMTDFELLGKQVLEFAKSLEDCDNRNPLQRDACEEKDTLVGLNTLLTTVQ